MTHPQLPAPEVAAGTGHPQLPEPGTDLKELAAQAALLSAIGKEVAARAKVVRERLETGLRQARKEHGTRSVEVTVPDDLGPGGESVAATVAFNKDGDPSVIICDTEAATEWVAQHHPTFIREIIDPLFQAALLKDMDIVDGQIVYSRTGEVVDWARPVPGAPGSMAVRHTKGGPGKPGGDEMLLAAWQSLRFGTGRDVLPAPSSSLGQGGG